MPASALIGNLAVNLTMETASFQSAATKAEVRAKTLQGRLSKIGDSIKGFGVGLVAGVGVSAIVGLTKNAFDLAAALDESSQKMGVSVEALQELNLAAEQSGVSQEALATSMAKLNKSLGALEQGSKPAVDAFAKLGLAAEDFKGKSPDQSLRIIADALNKLPDVQQRVAVGSQIMGKGFSELLPLINEGSAGLDKYAEKSRQVGEITTEEARQLDSLSDSWERLKVRVGVALAKIIATMAELVSKNDAFVTGWYNLRDQTIAAVEQMASGVLRALSGMVQRIKAVVVDRLNAVWKSVTDKVASVTTAFENMYDKVVGHSYVPDMVEGIASEFARLGQIMVDPTVSATEKVGAAFQTLQGVIAQVLGKKTGGIFSMITSMVSVFAPLFGGKTGGLFGAILSGASGGSSTPWSETGLYPGIDLPGFASGGGGVFGGRAGIDNNLLSLNGWPIAHVSRGEPFSIGGRNSDNIVVHQTIAPNFAGNAATQDDLYKMAVMTKNATMQAINEERRRR